jgi:putative Mn2+ efflux pump MntP
VNALRLEVASQLLNQILLYIPNIIAAVIVVVVGLYAAIFVATLVRTAAANAGIEEAKFVSEIARYALIVFAFAIAINQLGIGQSIIGPTVLILFGAAGLAAAIAVGLGARDLVARYLAKRFGKV